MDQPSISRRKLLALGTTVVVYPLTKTSFAQQDPKKSKPQTPPPTHPPLEAADVSHLPKGTKQLDLFLLMGQSNMKGRGIMPDDALRNANIMMMHLRDDGWYVARHPVHLVGNAQTFEGADNAGVGPGLAFAESLVEQNPKLAIGLIPCAVGGSAIGLWQKSGKLYVETLRRARLALNNTSALPTRIAGALWLQGEANANAAGLAVHDKNLLQLVDNLRADLELPDLPFIACTIGEMGDPEKMRDKSAMNRILLSLPSKRANTACVDAREIKSHIGDNVHFDTAAQNEIGRRFAEQFTQLSKQAFHWVSPLTKQETEEKPLPATVVHQTFTSPSMGKDVGYYIYLPPGYASSQERFPVVFHLHGGRPGAEKKAVRLSSYVDQAIAAGLIQPTIYVFPNGGPISWYDMPEMPKGLGESVFVNELVPHIDATYRTWGKREGRALEGYSQGGRGTTRIMFKHPELFLSVAPGGSGYGPEKTIQENEGYENDGLRFLPLGYNAWDLARAYAERTSRPKLNIMLWDGTMCFNYEFNVKYSAYLKELGLDHDLLIIQGVGHTASGSYDKNGNDLMLHHQKSFALHHP